MLNFHNNCSLTIPAKLSKPLKKKLGIIHLKLASLERTEDTAWFIKVPLVTTNANENWWFIQLWKELLSLN